MDIAGGDVLMLFLEGVIYFLLIFLIEYLSNKSDFSRMITGED